jgi:hypothetical protein
MMSSHAPILAPQNEWVALKTACDHADRKDRAMREWVRRFGIGRQSSKYGSIQVHLPALEAVMADDLEVLELIRAGDRSDPRVRRIYEYLLLPLPKRQVEPSVSLSAGSPI